MVLHENGYKSQRKTGLHCSAFEHGRCYVVMQYASIISLRNIYVHTSNTVYTLLILGPAGFVAILLVKNPL